MMPGISAELRLIIQCIRRAFGREDEARAWELDEPPSWELVLQLANRHGLTPLVHANLARVTQSAPPRIRALLEAGYRASALRAQAWQEPTVRLSLGILAEHGIEPVVLKGAALAYTGYPEPCLRTMSDLDLLLRAEELGRASEALERAGFSTLETEPRPPHHLPLHCAPGGRAAVELHGHILPEAGQVRLDLEAMRRRAVLAKVAGVQARVFAPADALHFACLHLALTHRYRWYTLRNLTDVLAISSQSAGELDWSLFVETVRRSRTAGAVYWTLWLSRAWLGAPVPGGVLASLTPSGLIRRLLADAFEPRYLLAEQSPHETSDDVLRATLVELSLCTGYPLPAQLQVFFQTLFPSPDGITHLPPEVRHSPVLYAAALASPRRVWQGWKALVRLIERTAR